MAGFLPIPAIPLTRRLGHGHPAILRLPVAERRVADPVLAAQLGGLHASLLLAQHPTALLLD